MFSNIPANYFADSFEHFCAVEKKNVESYIYFET